MKAIIFFITAITICLGCNSKKDSSATAKKDSTISQKVKPTNKQDSAPAIEIIPAADI